MTWKSGRWPISSRPSRRAVTSRSLLSSASRLPPGRPQVLWLCFEFRSRTKASPSHLQTRAHAFGSCLHGQPFADGVMRACHYDKRCVDAQRRARAAVVTACARKRLLGHATSTWLSIELSWPSRPESGTGRGVISSAIKTNRCTRLLQQRDTSADMQRMAHSRAYTRGRT